MTMIRRLLLSLLVLAGAQAVRAVEPIHALFIAGGCCHDYVAQKTILTEGISARANVTWDILFEGGSSRGGVIRDHRMSIYEKPDWAKGYDVIVHDECFGDVTNAEFIEHIAKAHFDGVPAVVIHCSIHSYRRSTTDEWRKLLGVSSYYHDPGRQFEVTNVMPDHPIMKGFPALWQDPAKDELYRMKKLWPDCVPLAKTIAITEGLRVKAEGTFTNLLNHTNLGDPNMDLSSSSFGLITNTVGLSGGSRNSDFGGARTGQISVRVEF